MGAIAFDRYCLSLLIATLAIAFMIVRLTLIAGKKSLGITPYLGQGSRAFLKR
jgi:hypothetical protein